MSKNDADIFYDLVDHKPLAKEISLVQPKHVESLRLWHRIAAGVHGVSMVVQLIVILIYASQNHLFSVNVTRVTNGSILIIGTYYLAWLIFAFTPFTVVGHIINSFFTRRELENNGTNIIRWIEYAITAGIMTVAIAQASGATDVFILVSLFACNIGVQLLGYMHEYLNQKQQIQKYKLAVIHFQFDWFAFGLACALFVAQWIVIFYYFFDAIAVAGASNVPWFVYTIIIGLFIQFSNFAIWMIMHYMRPLFVCGWTINPLSGYTYAMGWIILSLVAKLFLVWITLIGAITR